MSKYVLLNIPELSNDIVLINIDRIVRMTSNPKDPLKCCIVVDNGNASTSTYVADHTLTETYTRINNATEHNKTPKEYISIKAVSTMDLTRWVNDSIKSGFQPFGGISCSALTVDEKGVPTNTAVFCQAMVKY